jgi:hypothetical protein
MIVMDRRRARWRNLTFGEHLKHVHNITGVPSAVQYDILDMMDILNPIVSRPILLFLSYHEILDMMDILNPVVSRPNLLILSY